MSTISETNHNVSHPLLMPEILEQMEKCKSNLFYQKVAFVVCSIALGILSVSGLYFAITYSVIFSESIALWLSISPCIQTTIFSLFAGCVITGCTIFVMGMTTIHNEFWKEKAVAELASIGINKNCIYEACRLKLSTPDIARCFELLEYSGQKKKYIEYTEYWRSIANQAIHSQNSGLISLLQDHGIDFFDDTKLNTIPILSDAIHYGNPEVIDFVLNFYDNELQDPLPQLSLSIAKNPLVIINSFDDKVLENINYIKTNYRNLFNELLSPNIYGHTPIDMAMQLKKDFILPTLMEKNIEHIRQLPNYGIRPSPQQQYRLIKRFEKYLELQSSIEGAEREINFDKGVCNGLCFYESYLNTKSRDRWKNYLSVINAWDGTPEGLKDTELTSQFNGRFRDVGDFFESILNDIIWFQQSDNQSEYPALESISLLNPFSKKSGNEIGAAFPFYQKDKANQLRVVSPENDTITLTNSKQSRFLTKYNFSEFKIKMEELFELPASTYIEVNSGSHVSKIEILPESRYRYFEPNARYDIPPFDNQNTLLEFIWKVQFKIDITSTQRTHFSYCHYKFEVTNS